MKKFLTTKFFGAVIFFCLGFLTNHLLVKMNWGPHSANAERFPVNPDDFNQERMLDTIKRMNVDQDTDKSILMIPKK